MFVEDVAAHCERARANGATIPEEPHDIVNVPKREAEIYSAPEDGQYGRKRTFAPHETIVSDVFPGEPLTPAEFVLG